MFGGASEARTRDPWIKSPQKYLFITVDYHSNNSTLLYKYIHLCKFYLFVVLINIHYYTIKRVTNRLHLFTNWLQI